MSQQQALHALRRSGRWGQYCHTASDCRRCGTRQTLAPVCGGVQHATQNRSPCITGRAFPDELFACSRKRTLVNGRKIPLLVLAAWFTCRSSTGSRERHTTGTRQPALPHNGQRTDRLILSIHKPLGAWNKRLGRRWGCSASPDTGQHGGCVRPFGAARLSPMLAGGRPGLFVDLDPHENPYPSCAPCGVVVPARPRLALLSLLAGSACGASALTAQPPASCWRKTCAPVVV